MAPTITHVHEITSRKLGFSLTEKHIKKDIDCGRNKKRTLLKAYSLQSGAGRAGRNRRARYQEAKAGERGPDSRTTACTAVAVRPTTPYTKHNRDGVYGRDYGGVRGGGGQGGRGGRGRGRGRGGSRGKN